MPRLVDERFVRLGFLLLPGRLRAILAEVVGDASLSTLPGATVRGFIEALALMQMIKSALCTGLVILLIVVRDRVTDLPPIYDVPFVLAVFWTPAYMLFLELGRRMIRADEPSAKSLWVIRHSHVLAIPLAALATVILQWAEMS